MIIEIFRSVGAVLIGYVLLAMVRHSLDAGAVEGRFGRPGFVISPTFMVYRSKSPFGFWCAIISAGFMGFFIIIFGLVSLIVTLVTFCP